MIVTSGGMIAGYTDMSLVGERADEKLPEYAAILRRVASSQEHGSFRAELDGRPCMIFSSETSNHWYLILSADLSTLYGDSYRQMAMMASVNLLMLAVVLVFRQLASRRSRQAEAVVSETEKHLGGFSQRLHELAAHLKRLGDVRLIREDDGPAEIAGKVGDSGQQLSVLADELSAYSDALRRQTEEAQGAPSTASASPRPISTHRPGPTASPSPASSTGSRESSSAFSASASSSTS